MKESGSGLVDLWSFAPAVTLQRGFHNEISIERLRRRELGSYDTVGGGKGGGRKGKRERKGREAGSL